MATPSELLNRLRDIQPAPDASWWPPAPGWWIIAAVVGIVSALYFWRSRRSTWYAQALSEMRRIERDFVETRNAARCVAQLSILLRSVAMTRAPGPMVAGLTGEAWLRYLDEQLAARDFSKGAGRVLLTAPYMPAAEIDVPALSELTRQWLKSVN